MKTEMTEKKKLLAFGDIIWDVYGDGAVIGGATLNFCAHAVKCGMNGVLMSSVGYDELGDRALCELDRLGVDRRLVVRTPFETGKSVVTLGEGGSPAFTVIQNTAYDNIPADDAALESLAGEGFDALYFGTLSQRGPVSRNTLRRILERLNFKEIFCDVNLRRDCYDEGSVSIILENATILKISDEEEPLLDVSRKWTAAKACGFPRGVFDAFPSVHTILLTRGSEGSVIYLRGGSVIDIPPVRTVPVSTVGAGDSYGAAYLSLYLRGASPEEAGRVASTVSSRVVSVTAAVPDYSLDEFK